jgi:hypothetical protein
MATYSLRSGVRVEWDPIARRIKNLDSGKLEELGMA